MSLLVIISCSKEETKNQYIFSDELKAITGSCYTIILEAENKHSESKYKEAISLANDGLNCIATNKNLLKSSPFFWEIIGNSHRSTKNYEKAVQAYETAHQLGMKYYSGEDLTIITLRQMMTRVSGSILLIYMTKTPDLEKAELWRNVLSKWSQSFVEQ